MAAPAFRAKNDANTAGATAASITVNKPTGTVDDDILIAIVNHTTGSSFTTVTAPSGWTLLDERTQNDGENAYRATAYWKKAASEGASYTWTPAVSAYMAAGISCYSGGDVTTPINAHSVNFSATSTTSNVCSAITTTVADTMLVALAASGWWDNTWTPPSGMTERVDTAVGSDWGSVSIADVTQVATGTTGTKTFTSSVSHSCAGFLIAIAPGAGGGGGSTFIKIVGNNFSLAGSGGLAS